MELLPRLDSGVADLEVKSAEILTGTFDQNLLKALGALHDFSGHVISSPVVGLAPGHDYLSG